MTSTPAVLTTIDLENVAKALEKQALELRKQAAKLDNQLTRDQANKKLVATLTGYGKAAAKAHNWRKTGLDSAFCATFFPPHTPIETAIHYTRLGCDAERHRIKSQRDRDAMRRARLGETNAAIGKALGISSRTVSKIISEGLRQVPNGPSEPTRSHPQPPRRRPR